MMNSLIWNPSPELFRLPYLDHPVTWYGFFFALGLGISYLQFLRLLKTRAESLNESFTSLELQKFVDPFVFYIFIGILIGARLFEVIFYSPHLLQEGVMAILKTWEGGLASHGGILGAYIGTLIFSRAHSKSEVWIKTRLSLMVIFDFVAVSSGTASFFIRVGNFFNQEIVGTVSELPWAVTFLNPKEGVPGISRHPVQLYEAFYYLGLWLIFYPLYKNKFSEYEPGRLGVFYLFVLFIGRFLLEFFKAPQTLGDQGALLSTGQLLSFGYIFGAGLYLMKPKSFKIF